ncbi:hypothetical protein PIB30_042702 [Stylosanthes scabra]|uniref:Uncharacterized protein n=1 Tax=Stylosanthes scabra TaxID=79078 RepID=A0ABU6XFL1_9FABA|nr:hypothetical protein [Stylosanthes scabra]
MECFITWQLELENSGLFDRKPIINSLLNKTNEPKRKEACGARNGVLKQFCFHAYAYFKLTQPCLYPLIKPRRSHQLCLSTLRRGNARICVDRHSSAPEQVEPTPRRDPGSLGVAQTSSTSFRVHA